MKTELEKCMAGEWYDCHDPVENVSVGDNFTCGFGTNIYIGSNVSINLNCTFIDCNRIPSEARLACRPRHGTHRGRSGGYQPVLKDERSLT